MTFSGAFLNIDITPLALDEGRPVALQGKAAVRRDGDWHFRTVTAVMGRPQMQLLLLTVEPGYSCLIVAADVFGFDAELVAAVREEALRWGIPPEALILNASHTHYNAGTHGRVAKALGPFHADYTRWLQRSICAALPQLFSQRTPCELEYGEAETEVGVCRRKPVGERMGTGANVDGPYDRTVGILRITWKDPKRIVLAVTHGCHPTGLDSESVLSSDYPGFMREALHAVVDGVMFLQGAGATAKPRYESDDGIRFAKNVGESRAAGERLAAAIRQRIDKPMDMVRPSLAAAKYELALQTRRSPTVDEITSLLTGPDLLDQEWAGVMMAEAEDASGGRGASVEVQLIELGSGVVLIGLSGEPSAELGLELRAAVAQRDRRAVMLGYCNELRGYLLTDRELEEGGYEAVRGARCYLQREFLPGAADKIGNAIIAGLAQFAAGTSPQYGTHGADVGPAFFVMSSGRCGTQTLAHIAGLANNARVWHHPQPDPISESLDAYWGRIDKRQVFLRLRSGVMQTAWTEGLIHGETDVGMTPFCDQIARDLPRARFVVLVRHPADFVRSGMRRNYYVNGGRWDSGRLRPFGDDEEWNALPQFDKICWLWAETYRLIERMVAGIGPDRVLLVRFEDLVKGTDEAERIYRFLGLQGFSAAAVERVLGQRLNFQAAGEFPSPEVWSSEMHQRLWKYCGAVAARYGYAPAVSGNAVPGPSSRNLGE